MIIIYGALPHTPPRNFLEKVSWNFKNFEQGIGRLTYPLFKVQEIQRKFINNLQGGHKTKPHTKLPLYHNTARFKTVAPCVPGIRRGTKRRAFGVVGRNTWARIPSRRSKTCRGFSRVPLAGCVRSARSCAEHASGVARERHAENVFSFCNSRALYDRFARAASPYVRPSTFCEASCFLSKH